MSKLFGGTVRSALVHAVTQYDIRQSKTKRYNRFALAIYLGRVDDICADIEAGAPVRDAICAAVTGTLLSALLRAVHETPPTKDELTGRGRYVYRRVSIG